MDKFPDKGCKRATTFLKRQSHCQECPFPDCLEGTKVGVVTLKKTERNKAIIADYCAGMGWDEMVAKYKVSSRTIARILKAWRKGKRNGN